ncbi:MAG: hypothetical protein ACU0CA_11605 [Paracoccaceae bacterium]
MWCKRIFWIFAVLYGLALALLIIGTFGLFSQETDPLSGIFLIPIGLPWGLLVDQAPEPMWPWLAALAPAINLWLISRLCRRMNKA